MKNLGGNLLIGAGLFVSLNLLHAALIQVSAQPVQSLGAVAAAPPDSIVQATAQAQGLLLVAPADLPAVGGTFWLVTTNGIAAPSPCPPGNLSDFPVYAMADGIFLVDETGGQVATNADNGGTAESALAAEADAVVNLINQVQAAQAAPLNGGTAMAAGRGAGMAMMMADFSSMMTPAYDTNGLWLEMTNLANGWSYFNLHNGTNFVYAILSTTSLAGGTWNVETELFPTLDQTNVLPFVVQNFDRQNLFVKAMDWTGVTENGNTVPDWWLWEYYGTTALTDSSPDANGNPLSSDYQNGTDPNIISFTVEAANQYVNLPFANAQLNISAGTPNYYAVLVNGQTTTNWLPFVSTNLTVSLGSTDGVYAVSVGLRGLPANATQTWESYSFTLDTVPPVVTITNPIIGSNAVTKPYLQLQGFANKPLATLSYDLNNAFGVATNQNAFVTGQTFDTNQFDFTTNYFQAYDVPLATNDNYITLRLTDRAGNLTTTNFDVVLDYAGATNPPVVNLIWPTNGMAVSGSSITIRGTMSDETGTVVAQIVDEDGNTNTVTGIVERNNMFWIENVPLNGTSQISLQATDAAGNVTTNNFTVSPSDLILTIDSTPTGDALYQPVGSVSGTVSDPTATVTVNGMTVTNDFWTDGVTWYWEVDNVPIYGQGTATFDASAVTPGLDFFSSQRLQAMFQPMASSSSSSPPANASATVEMGPYVAIVSYHSVEEQDYSDVYYSSTSRVQKDQTAQAVVTNGQWTMSGQATNDSRWADTYDGSSESVYTWSVGSPGAVLEHYTDSYGYTYDGPVGWFDDSGVYQMEVTAIPHEDQDWGCASCGDSYEWAAVRHYYADGTGMPYHWDLGGGGTFDLGVTAKTEVKLYTGGKAGVGRQNLFQINAWANEIQRPPLDYGTDYPWWDVQEVAIASTALTVGNQPLGADGNLWLALPDNSEPFITVHAPGKRHFDAWATPTKYPYYINLATSTTNVDLSTTNVPEICVGQTVTLGADWQGGVPPCTSIDNVWWHLPDKYVNQQTNYSTNCTSYVRNDNLLTNTAIQCWYVNGDGNTNACSVRETLHFANGQSVNIAAAGSFTVYRPQVTQFTPLPPFTPMISTNALGYLVLGLGDQATGDGYMWFKAAVESKSPYLGSAGWTQLANRNVAGHARWGTYGQYWLDNTEFAQGTAGFSSGAATNEWSDGPGIAALANVTVTDNFKTYLCFKPPGNGVWVTLGMTTWGWSATTLNGSLQSTNVIQPTNSISDEFPIWPKTIYNGRLH